MSVVSSRASMPLIRSRHWLARPLPAGLILLAVAGMLLSAAALTHTHVGPGPGLYNQEHDLTLLATRSGGAPLPDVTPGLGIVVAVSSLPAPATEATPAAPRSLPDSRAPPAH